LREKKNSEWAAPLRRSPSGGLKTLASVWIFK